jgi:putative transcriptional regulator
MSVSFHPAPELLLAYAAGSLDEPTSLLIAAHASLCGDCRDEIQLLEAVGGAVLESLPPDPLAGDALDSWLRRLPTPAGPVLDEGMTGIGSLPASVNHYLPGGGRAARWRWLAPGIQQTLLLRGAKVRVRMLRIAALTPVPRHGHAGTEITLVLQGAYHDENGDYGVGDFTVADGDRVHRPVASPQGCVCLILSNAPMYLTSRLGRLVNPFMPF